MQSLRSVMTTRIGIPNRLQLDTVSFDQLKVMHGIAIPPVVDFETTERSVVVEQARHRTICAMGGDHSLRSNAARHLHLMHATSTTAAFCPLDYFIYSLGSNGER
jgi:hypothetical protein